MDVPDVEAPELLDAQPIDAIFPKTSMLENVSLHYENLGTVSGESVRFFVRAQKGKPARLCTTPDGKTITCGPPMKSGLPTEASGRPWLLGSEDGAPTLLAFGFEGSVANGRRSRRASFDRRWSSVDQIQRVLRRRRLRARGGSALLLLKDAAKAEGDHFQVGRLACERHRAQNERGGAHRLERRSEVRRAHRQSRRVGRFLERGERQSDRRCAVHVRGRDAKHRDASGPRAKSLATICVDTDLGCQTKSAGLAIAMPTEADGVSKTLVVFATDAGFGKADIVEAGELSCGDDAAYVLGDASLATCKPDGCKSDTFEAAHGTPQQSTARSSARSPSRASCA